MKSYKLDFNDFGSTEALKAKLDELTRDGQAFDILSGGDCSIHHKCKLL